MADYSMANKKIAYTLGSSTNGYMGITYFQECGPRFLTCPQLVGTWVQNIFQEFVPIFLPCHVPSVACHGVSISIVSISSVSCRVRILRVSMSMPCRGHPAAAYIVKGLLLLLFLKTTTCDKISLMKCCFFSFFLFQATV